MRINHIAIYTNDLEKLKSFYIKYFKATSNNLYHNPKSGLKTYFLSFDDGARLELMTSPEVKCEEFDRYKKGLIHLAFSVGSKENVDEITKQIESDGFEVLSQPRNTGDGYYESCILDPENNIVEIVI